MVLYEIGTDGLKPREISAFSELNLYERQDLQRLIREHPTALGEQLLIIAEEYGNWEDARRRIDLLALDHEGNLVVIELKRTSDGGHMELQAIRYAAMVSSMTFDEVADAYERYRSSPGSKSPDVDGRAEIAEFLGLTDEIDSVTISTKVRIILVSAGFGREITTTVLWLNSFEGMDIRCLRLSPYDIDGTILLDIQQVIPLPEAEDYQVRLRRKQAEAEKTSSSDGRDFTRYHILVDGRELPAENKRNAVLLMITELARAGVGLGDIRAHMASDRQMRSVPGLLASADEVSTALAGAYPGLDIGRYFTQHPLLDEANKQTYVITKMWGQNTESTLQILAANFVGAKVSFRAAT